MRALVLRSPGDLKVMDVPVPALSAGQVLVEVSRCGICGSDVRYFHGENPWARQTLGRDEPVPGNIILGHELVGTVVAACDRAGEHLLGKRVGINTWTTCGTCRYCKAGRINSMNRDGALFRALFQGDRQDGCPGQGVVPLSGGLGRLWRAGQADSGLSGAHPTAVRRGPLAAWRMLDGPT